MKKFLKYVLGTLVCPESTLEKILEEPSRLVYGTGAVIFVGVLYTTAALIGYFHGFGAVVEPWIPISAEHYYLYLAPFGIPLFLLLTLIPAAIVQFSSRFLGGKGTFEDCVAVFGFSIWVPILPFMWFPEALSFIAFTKSTLPWWLELTPMIHNIRQILAVLWAFAVTIIGIRKVQKFSWGKSIIVGLVALVATMIIAITYIR
jgi:hypothetical protein